MTLLTLLIAAFPVITPGATDTIPARQSMPASQGHTPRTSDSVWAAVTAAANVVPDGEGGRWVRNALYIAFRDRDAAVNRVILDSLGGRSVGGVALGTAVFHLVVFDDMHAAGAESALRDILARATALRAHPAVRGVLTIELTGGMRAPCSTPDIAPAPGAATDVSPSGFGGL